MMRLRVPSLVRLVAPWHRPLICLALVGALAALALGKESAKVIPLSRENTEACMACHVSEMGGRMPVDLKALKASPHKDLKCQDCHPGITGAPHTPQMLATKATCGTCHPAAREAYAKSVHARADKVAGDHPTCVACHGQGGNPHAVARPAAWPRADKVAVCSRCHAQRQRMERYGVDPDAVPSYNESFHGKALLRFGLTKAAICSDCHGYHTLLPPSNPQAPTNRSHAASTCGQKGCHQGAQVNFAMSGANHLRLKIKQSPVLHIEELFFRYLTFGTILLLLIAVALDLRRKVFAPRPPESGRSVAVLISFSFLLLALSLAMAYSGLPSAKWSATAAVVVMAFAFVIYLRHRPREHRKAASEPHYLRFTVAQRWQHGLLAVSFTLLVLTGLPLRFAHADVFHPLYAFFGGIHGARLVHRVAAVVMIFDWIWHTVYLGYRWKRAGFKLSSWTMWPSPKDFADFFGVVKNYLGFSSEEPKYDRFQFREKFDYFAVYWGMPIMVFSGLVLWFPIYYGNRLPEIGLSVAYIAHSDEAILAFLTILTWHFYNTHFNPDAFPMSPTFLTGRKTRTEMEREHPLELQRIESGQQRAAQPPTVPPARPVTPQPERTEGTAEPAEPEVREPVVEKQVEQQPEASEAAQPEASTEESPDPSA